MPYYMGCNMDFSKWQQEILYDVKYLVFHNYNVFLRIFFLSEIRVFQSDQFLLFMYLYYFRRLLLSKWIMEKTWNTRYATNDDNVGFINQMKNRNTSRKTEYDMKLSKNYFSSVNGRFRVKTTEVRRVHVHSSLLVVTSNQNASNKKNNRLDIYPKPGMSHYIPCLIAE